MNEVHFVMAGRITAWDPVKRLLFVGAQCLWVPPSVPVGALSARPTVVIAGYRPRPGPAPWRVQTIQADEPIAPFE
jgi:hypothetical protein